MLVRRTSGKPSGLHLLGGEPGNLGRGVAGLGSSDGIPGRGECTRLIGETLSDSIYGGGRVQCYPAAARSKHVRQIKSLKSW